MDAGQYVRSAQTAECRRIMNEDTARWPVSRLEDSSLVPAFPKKRNQLIAAWGSFF